MTTAGSAADPDRPGSTCSSTATDGELASTRRCGLEKDTKRGKRRWKLAEPFADERCSEAILEFLRTTDVGRKVPVEKAETESSESGTEQECPRGECVCGLCGW